MQKREATARKDVEEIANAKISAFDALPEEEKALKRWDAQMRRSAMRRKNEDTVIYHGSNKNGSPLIESHIVWPLLYADEATSAKFVTGPPPARHLGRAYDSETHVLISEEEGSRGPLPPSNMHPKKHSMGMWMPWFRKDAGRIHRDDAKEF